MPPCDHLHSSFVIAVPYYQLTGIPFMGFLSCLSQFTSFHTTYRKPICLDRIDSPLGRYSLQIGVIQLCNHEQHPVHDLKIISGTSPSNF